MQEFQKRAVPFFQFSALLILCLLSFSAFGQKKVVTSDQIWIQSYNEAKISEKWTALLDGGLRWRGSFDEQQAYIVRGGMAYSLSQNLRISAGFAHQGFYAEKKIIRHEYRPYQEILLKDNLGKINLSHRFRVEERFFKDKLMDFSKTEFNFRFRYAIMLGIPLANLSAANPQRKLVLNLGDEIFLNAGKEITHRIFDQNRVIISPTLQWNRDLSIAFTYNSQFASTAVPEIFLQSHVAWLQIRYNLDLTR